MVVGVLVTMCCLRGKPRLSWCRGRAIVGGSAGVNPEAAETLKWIAEAWWEQLVLYTDSEAIVTRT